MKTENQTVNGAEFNGVLGTGAINFLDGGYPTGSESKVPHIEMIAATFDVDADVDLTLVNTATIGADPTQFIQLKLASAIRSFSACGIIVPIDSAGNPYELRLNTTGVVAGQGSFIVTWYNAQRPR